MKVIRDEAYQRYLSITQEEGFGGSRVKNLRDQPLTPGGRVRMTLFERSSDEERPHPRMRTEMPPAKDPSPSPTPLYARPWPAPADAAAFRASVRAALDAAAGHLAASDLDDQGAPEGSEHFWRHSIHAQRVARLLSEAGAALSGLEGALPAAELSGARRALAELADEAYAGSITFDDADTGTYHSFQHDRPFVHYLEAILLTLPDEASSAFSLLPPEQQESVVRQRTQARKHLDYLMRRKYANHGVTETDIERTVGGLLIDQNTRHVASETLASRGTLVPTYELLRVDPASAQASAGAWLYRGDDDKLHLEDTGEVVEVADDQIRSVTVSASELTFKRAPDDPRLRKGVRFDWDGNGYVSSTPIGWISWAGHCDIKAIMEGLGLALQGAPALVEYRAETGQSQTYDRTLLLEMIASIFELGSSYTRLDRSGKVVRGIHRFGGARDDGLPDRLQFQGTAGGRSFRWPMGGRSDVFTVTKLTASGQEVDLKTAFFRWKADLDVLDFSANPLYRETVEGDYNIIDVTGAVLEADVQMDAIDPKSGYPVTRKQHLVLDLRPDSTEPRVLLGTWLRDAARREIWNMTLDRAQGQIEAESLVHELVDGVWTPRSQGVVWKSPVATPLSATLSREMKSDDPALFQALLQVALRDAQNINADTDDEAEVWNGTVVSLNVGKVRANEDTRVEHWRVALRARFGSASMEYLQRRGEDGTPQAWCPLPGQDRWAKAPDFLWQDFPDVGSKGVEGGDWVANTAMWDRGIIEVRQGAGVSGDAYVYDDHIKNLFEMVFCALGGLPYTVVHNNKRYGFADEASWSKATALIEASRGALTWE